MLKNLQQKILKDVSIKLTEEFDRNFERKAFFNTAWKPSKFNKTGALLLRTGDLRRSIRATIEGTNIIFSSSLPYASLHNQGGEIKVTQKMKAFFWYKFREVTGGVKITPTTRLSQEAEFYKALALKKIGTVIKVEQRQFIGDHPIIKERIETIVAHNIKVVEHELSNLFKQKK